LSGELLDVGPCHGCFVESGAHFVFGLDPLALYVQNERGHLLDAGGVADQPGVYIDAMNTIVALDSYDRKVERAKEKKKLDKMNRRRAWND
jgi:hypothetical protein